MVFPTKIEPFVPSEVEGRCLAQTCLDFSQRLKFIPSACLGRGSTRTDLISIKSFVVPLLPESQVPPPARQLNPVFAIEGKSYIMATQFCAAIAMSDLAGKIASLQSEDRQNF